MKLSQRILGMKPSATLAVDAKAKELRSQGKNVISFGSGEPDFTSPEAAFRYAKEAMETGKTHYTPTPGIPELRREICSYYQKEFGLEFLPEQVVVGSGAKPCIYEALAAIVDPEDEVILPAPAWVSYIEQIHLLGGKTVIVDTESNNFIPNIEDIEAAVTDKTVALLLNSPSNPTGMVYNENTIRGLGEIALKHNLWLIWDEIYEQLVYGDNKHCNPLQLMPELAARTIIINGVSKAYAMTGWRIGYSIAPKPLALKINDFQSHLTSNASSIAQWAAVGAMRESMDDVKNMKAAFESRRRLICDLLRAMPHIAFREPEGAFYVFVNIKKCIGMTYEGQLITDDMDFCSKLLEGQLVAVVPGSAFLAPGYLRISYASSPETITEGMQRLHAFLNKLQ
ncbi:pyridoxal phosphate-dependent aminotransferase [Dehalobacter sp. DCM]|uniref:pyridoxal phosphate-dependent aminotransferase n=1 Tax=Dehalobacter sp. DCM TaxID=2907827 RepID=UPI003081BB93|nr:pyridoxal phosphate-dependent aminotransferase [Dehalobacter sp. DCM]